MPYPDELTQSLASSSGAVDSNIDLEAADEPRWASWARQAAERVRQSASEAADQAQRAAAGSIERAKSVDWSEQVKSVQAGVSSTFDAASDRVALVGERMQDNVTQGVDRAKSVDWSEHGRGLQRGISGSFDSVSTSASSAASAVQEKGRAGMDITREYTRESVESLHLTETFTKAKDGASVAAGAVTGAASSAREYTGQRVSNLSALTISPTTWAQFAGVFFVGTLFIMLSLSFLPVLLLSPQKFAVLFTIGSMTMLSSFVIFSRPKAFLTSMSQRDKLPFSAMYVISLIGTLWATLLLRSLVLTAVFALIQAVALLYFVASYLPGGKATVTMCCRLCGRSVRSTLQV